MKHVTLALAAVFAFALAGCNTVKGVGKDVEKVGEATQKKADEVSKDLKKDDKKK